ncbi:hypothetical protein DPSP01_014670 [Paraphaeosphaeria sporulosa]
MVSQDPTADTTILFNVNFSAMANGEVHHPSSPWPVGSSGNFAAQQASSVTEDGRQDVQNAPEISEKQILHELHEFQNVEIERRQRQDQQSKSILQKLETLTERQEGMEKQLNALYSLLESHPRHSEPLSLSTNAQNMHDARRGRIPLAENAQRSTVRRSAPASQQGKPPHDIQQEMLRFLRQHKNNPTGLPYDG